MIKKAKTCSTKQQDQGKRIKSKRRGKLFPQRSDRTVLDKARLFWLLGEWNKLAELAGDELRRHPDRAQLALLMASALLQLDAKKQAKAWLVRAQEWGCDEAAVANILLSGAYNNLGRAAHLLDQPKRAAEYLASAVSIGYDGTSIPLISELRVREQLQQLAQDKAEYRATRPGQAR